MFSRIRNHEKLVENGENPSIVARKLKEGTHEKDSDPFRILGNNGNSLKTVYIEDTVKTTENSIAERGRETEIIEGGEREIKRKGKGRDRGREEEEEVEGAVTELIMKDPVDAEEDKNAFSLSLSLPLSLKKNKRPKNGTINLEFNLSEVQDLHSYKEPSSKNHKGKNVLKEVVSEVVRYDGEIFILFYHLILLYIYTLFITTIKISEY